MDKMIATLKSKKCEIRVQFETQLNAKEAELKAMGADVATYVEMKIDAAADKAKKMEELAADRALNGVALAENKSAQVFPRFRHLFRVATYNRASCIPLLPFVCGSRWTGVALHLRQEHTVPFAALPQRASRTVRSACLPPCPRLSGETVPGWVDILWRLCSRSRRTGGGWRRVRWTLAPRSYTTSWTRPKPRCRTNLTRCACWWEMALGRRSARCPMAAPWPAACQHHL